MKSLSSHISLKSNDLSVILPRCRNPRPKNHPTLHNLYQHQSPSSLGFRIKHLANFLPLHPPSHPIAPITRTTPPNLFFMNHCIYLTRWINDVDLLHPLTKHGNSTLPAPRHANRSAIITFMPKGQALRSDRKIAIRTLLRLTRMDVCCGPPPSGCLR